MTDGRQPDGSTDTGMQEPSGEDIPKMSQAGLKKAIIIGAVLGALVTLGSAFAMDHFLADSLSGTWRDAAAKDVTRMFGPACGSNWFAVTMVLTVVMTFLAAFGAVLGIIGAVIVNRFFRLLLK